MRFLMMVLIVLIILFSASLLSAQEEDVPTILVIQGENTDQPHSRNIFHIDIHGNSHRIFTIDESYSIQDFQDGWLYLSDNLRIDLRQKEPEVVQNDNAPKYDYEELLTEVLTTPYTSLSEIRGIELPYPEYEWTDSRLYLMSGEGDAFTNFFAVRDSELVQLTDVATLFPEAQAPYLSASVAFIERHPLGAGFLYRARARDSNGTDHNAIYFYDIESQESQLMPFFGKNPTWSPDTTQLAGSRLGQLEDSRPVYTIWIVELATGAKEAVAQGCNVEWSPDGEWLAYDKHDNAQWQGYTDCYGNGQVAVFHLPSNTEILLTAELSGYIRLLGWMPED